MDSLLYRYQTNRNRLTHVDDPGGVAGNHSFDVDDQDTNSYTYDAFNLIERFTKRKDAEPIAGGEGCLPDAATAPLDDFRYRFGPLQEREQKRQYSTSQNQAIAGLMWNYSLLGADAKQLASYNGVQGGFCGQVANTVWIWPVEYNSYGPAQTRIITRPQGAKEFVIADHLGSTRLTLNQTGDILERLDYQPFGKEINEAGEGARTSYIGREKDTESELGFYGVRMYEPEYGRFMSVDPLWERYASMQPYQYAGNSPISFLDNNGKHIVGLRDVDRTYLRSAMQEQFGVEVGFNSSNVMTISDAQMTSASERLNVESYGQLMQIEELAVSEKTINVAAIEGTDDRSTRVTLTGPDALGIAGSTTGDVQTGVRQSEMFVSDPSRPTNSFVLIRPEIARTETFNAQGGGQTSPCGSCVLIHALLDHALPWKRLGFSATRTEGVENHNKALVRSGSAKVRDESDHTNQGQSR